MAMRISVSGATPRRTPFGAQSTAATPRNALLATPAGSSVPMLGASVGGGGGGVGGASSSSSSSLPAFKLPHHPLLDPAGADKPRLDFSDLARRIQNFTAKLDDFVKGGCEDMESVEREADVDADERRNKRIELERDMEEARARQKELCETVAAERAQDADLRSAVAQLTHKLAAYNERVESARSDIADLRRRIDAKRRERERSRQRLVEMKGRNEPERVALESLLGCRAKHTRGKDQISLVFSLLDPHDYDRKAWFTLDLSTRQYVLADHSPSLPDDVVARLTSELNRTRNPWGFTKAIRREWRRHFESAPAAAS